MKGEYNLGQIIRLYKKRMFEKLFSSYTIRGKQIKNRFTVPAMVTDFCNEDGTATDRFIRYHEEKAKGGWGLIITEDYNVDPLGHGYRATAGLWNDTQIASHKVLPPLVHAHDAIILAQIYHCGRQTNSGAIGGLPQAPSAIMCPFGDEIPVSIPTEEVKEIVSKYGDTALRVKKCGFDGVEVHGAHGYLINQFFSPYTNKRLDEYGGNFWNRTRFAREIISDIRKKCGYDFIVGMRLSGEECVEGGLTLADSKAIALMMEKTGVDIFNISAGNYLSSELNIPSSHVEHGWITNWAKEIRDIVDVPIITVSRINDPFLAESTLVSGDADFIAMGRASLVDPHMPNKTKEGRFEDIKRCIACNDGCIGTLITDNPIRCTLNPNMGHEYKGEITTSEEKKKVVIVGAGPAGLYASITAAQCGHDVTVYEKENHSGGQFYYAAIPPCKGEITDFLVWQTTQCEKLGVKLKYNTTADMKIIQGENPDAVILATGSKPVMAPIPGLKENTKTVFAKDILDGKVKPGNNCVVIGGGQVGAETAHFLAQMLRDVTILEMKDSIAEDAPSSISLMLISELEQRNVKMITGVTIVQINDDSILYRNNKINKNMEIQVDTIVVAVGYRSYNPLENELKELGIKVKVVGDAVKTRNALEATWEGYTAGKSM